MILAKRSKILGGATSINSTAPMLTIKNTNCFPMERLKLKSSGCSASKVEEYILVMPKQTKAI